MSSSAQFRKKTVSPIDVGVAVLLALVLSFALAGCASYGPPVVISSTFDPEAAAFIHQNGTAAISGQAFVRRDNGRFFKAAGTDVYLIPRTDYADERMAALYGEKKYRLRETQIPEADPVYETYMRTTIAGLDGKFTFEHVADGEYYVVAMIVLPNKVMPFDFPIMERVTIENGKNVRIVMRGY